MSADDFRSIGDSYLTDEFLDEIQNDFSFLSRNGYESDRVRIEEDDGGSRTPSGLVIRQVIAAGSQNLRACIHSFM